MNASQTSEPVLDQKRQQQAKKLARTRRNLDIIEYTLVFAVLLLLIFTGLSSKFMSLFNLTPLVEAVLYTAILTAGAQILFSPLSYYSDFVLSHRYGLSTQKFGEWVTDKIKSTGINLVLGAATVAVLYLYISILPDLWWLAGWATMVLLTVVITNLAPVLLIPLFYKMKPLDTPELKARLERLSEKVKTKVRGIYLIEFSRKGTTANAALMGLGNTVRIVLSDTLLQQYTTEEIEVITAHEMGHHNHKDVFRLLTVQSVILLAGFYLGSLAFKSSVTAIGFKSQIDVSAFPWLVVILAVFGLLITPLLSTFSRLIETQADEFALRLTDNPASFTSAMAKLTDQNLGEAQPGRITQVLFHDHPSYVQRELHAKRYEENSKHQKSNTPIKN